MASRSPIVTQTLHSMRLLVQDYDTAIDFFTLFTRAMRFTLLADESSRKEAYGTDAMPATSGLVEN